MILAYALERRSGATGDGMPVDACTWLSQQVAAVQLDVEIGGDGGSVRSPPQQRGSTVARMDALQDMVEDALLRHEVYIGALSPTGAPQGQLCAATMYGSSGSFDDGLVALGFDVTAAEPWRRLGLARLEGPAPTLESIADRARLGRDLLELGVRAPWARQRIGELRDLQDGIAGAAAHCEQDLGAVQVERRRARPVKWGQWMEAEPALGRWIATQTAAQPEKTWRILTSLSNAYDVTPDVQGPIVPPLEARRCLQYLSGDVNRMATFMDTVAGEGWVIWAPDGQEELGKLLSAYRRHQVRAAGRDRFRLVLLLRHPPVPGDIGPDLLLDLWRSPVWEDRNQDVVEAVRILREPVGCVISGSANPICLPQTIAVVQLGEASGKVLPSVQSWRSSLTAQGASGYVVVDCPRGAGIRTERLLQRAAIEQICRWEGPLPSPGSAKDAPRVIFRGYFAHPDVAAIDHRLVVRQVRLLAPDPSILVGSSAIYGTGAAMIAELTHPAGIRHIADLAEEVVFLDSRQSLVMPLADKSLWERAVTDAVTADAERCVTQVRWRKSRNAARPWVRPQMLPDAVRGAIGRAKGGRAGQCQEDVGEPVVMISLSGRSLGADPDIMLEAIFDRLAGILGKPLRQRHDGLVTTAYDWAPDRDASAPWAGKARLQLQSMMEARHLHQEVHGVPVWMGMEWTTLAVSHARLPVAPGTKQLLGGRMAGEAGRPSP